MRTVDIVSWKSEAWTQASKEFGIRGIPYVRVYGKDGALVYEMKGGGLDEIRAAIGRAAGP